MKKQSIILHTIDGEELVFTGSSLDYCCGNEEGSLVSVMGEKFDVVEKPSQVANLLDELED